MRIDAERTQCISFVHGGSCCACRVRVRVAPDQSGQASQQFIKAAQSAIGMHTRLTGMVHTLLVVSTVFAAHSSHATSSMPLLHMAPHAAEHAVLPSPVHTQSPSA
jgi:hypothetical protein